MLFLKYKYVKLKVRVCLEGHTVTMLIYHVTKMIGQLLIPQPLGYKIVRILKYENDWAFPSPYKSSLVVITYFILFPFYFTPENKI